MAITKDFETAERRPGSGLLGRIAVTLVLRNPRRHRTGMCQCCGWHDLLIKKRRRWICAECSRDESAVHR